jgi:putative heme iron utilization protein
MGEDEDADEEAPADLGAEVRRRLIEAKSGALATLSADAATEGFPFGSVVPFALTAEGAPFVLVANIAQHTKNMRRDPRVSLLVQEPTNDADPQAGWRATLLGRMTPLPADPALDARYRERVPRAEGYLATHDFGYWRLDPVRVRWIGGFGEIAWVEAREVLRLPRGAGLAEAAEGIMEHMNADHEDALRAMCEAFRGTRPARARIVDVDRAGFLVRADAPEGLEHFSFGREIAAADAREAFVSLARRARAALGGPRK